MNLGPSSRHLFGVPSSKGINYVKLNMYPDGGIVSAFCHMQTAPPKHFLAGILSGAIPCLRVGNTRLPS